MLLHLRHFRHPWRSPALPKLRGSGASRADTLPVKIVDFDIPATASPSVGAPPEGLVEFYWHFIRQTKGWYAAMFAASLTVALLDTVIPIFIGRLVALMGAPDRAAALT